MKHLISSLLILLAYNSTFAYCSSGGIWVSPKCSSSGLEITPENCEIQENSIFVIEGYATSQQIIRDLNTTYPIYLETERHKVALKVIELQEGMFRVTQAILEPTDKLEAGKTYTLKIDGLDDKQHLLENWNRKTEEYEPIAWTVQPTTDTEAPQWKSAPKLVDKTMVSYGCGPAIYAIFDVNIVDDSETLIKTEMVDITPDFISYMVDGFEVIEEIPPARTSGGGTYYLSPDKDGQLNVGHGMCSGAFDFEENRQYKIRFSLMDMAGNTDEKWTEWIDFDSPYEGYR